MVFIGFVVMMLSLVAQIFAGSSGSAVHAATMAPLTDTTHCASLGALIETDPITAGKTTIGYLNMYYNSSNGYNCAETTSASSTYGISKYMMVALYVCTQTSPSSTCTFRSFDSPYFDSDSDEYRYYAGPAGVYGKSRCIGAEGEVEYNGTVYTTYSSPHAGHCS